MSLQPIPIGEKRNLLTILEETRNPNRKGRFVKCECECGTELVISYYAFKREVTKSCGCLKKSNFHKRKIFKKEDYINKKFNMLLITGYDHKTTGKNFVRHYLNYLCDCGRTGIIRSCSIGISMSCGCYYKVNKRKLNGTKFGCFKKNAKQRDIEFNVTQEYLQNLYEKQNYLCAITGVDIDFSNVVISRESTASLDRIDSSKPYIEGNVQWVHKQVNIMKNSMSEEELYNWCQRIVDHNKGRF